MQILDTHQHFWKYDPQRHDWIDESMKIIQRDFLPEDLKIIYDQYNVNGCIAVQADQTEEETNFLLDLADENDFIKAVVGWVDLRSEKLEERLDYFSQFKKLAGFRHIVQGEPDVNFMLRDDFVRGISLLEKYGFTYDILVFPHQLGAALELVRKFPNQKFVVDHIAKPYIKDQFIDGWANQMQAISRSENVLCKISGMITEADWEKWTHQDLNPYIDTVYNAFGPNRLMYGSDWPVCLVAGEYEKVLGIVQAYLAGLSVVDQEKIMHKNGANFYEISQ